MHAWPLVLLAACRIDFDPRPGIDASGMDGAQVFEAEAFTSTVALGSHIWQLLTDSAGFRGPGFMQVTPNDNKSCTLSIPTTCSAISYQVTIPAATTFRVQIRARSFTVDEDSAWYGFDGVVADELDVVANGNWNWTLGPTPVATTAGVHTLTLWFREAGVRVDQIALTLDATPPP